MDKKFTITIPYENNFSDEQRTERALFEFLCQKNEVNDKLKVYGTLSLNEAIRDFHYLKYYRYSYRWGWDLHKHGFIDVKLIRNPASDYIWYLKFTAYDIVG